MALNVELDGFGILYSDDAANMSPTLSKQQQPPISPIESESSSGISSLDSDDLKKQLLSSPPTISHDDDDQQSDGTVAEKEKYESAESVEVIEQEKPIPVQVIYQNRNVLNIAENIRTSNHFIQYTVLPENNLTCFFQNRAQYWRLGSSSILERVDAMEKCSCCDFTYPSADPQPNQGQNNAKNAITDSLLTFLKKHIVDYSMPNNNTMGASNIKNMNNSNNMSGGMANNNPGRYAGTPYAAYQMMQQQYQTNNNTNNGYYNAMSGFNQQMTPFANNNVGGAGGTYNNGTTNNGTTLALLNLMNSASRNVSAFQAMNNNSRYYNNMNNNGFGLYKQF